MRSLYHCVYAMSFLVMPALAHAGGDTCRMDAPAAPIRPTLLSSVAAELVPASTQLGGASGVLAQSFDEALSVDNVLARLRIDGCRAMAKTAVPAAGMMDAATYKPQTAFDNTPWRFNMTQDGKRMTADAFDAWMKARGVRVVGRKDGAETAPADPASEAKAAN